MFLLQQLLDPSAPRIQRRWGLAWVYAVAVLIQLPNSLIAFFAIPKFLETSGWVYGLLWFLWLLLIVAAEIIKARVLGRNEPLAVVRAAMWDGLALAASSWLAIFALRMGFDFWPLVLLGLLAAGLGFVRLAARL